MKISINNRRSAAFLDWNDMRAREVPNRISGHPMRKLIAFEDDTADKLVQLGRDRMATLQDLAEEAFADLLKKHGIPIDLNDALRKSVRRTPASTKSEQPSPRRNRESAKKRNARA